MSPADAAAHLAARGEWSYSRASGPGGQRRDTAETRAVLVVRAEHLEGLPPPVARRLAEGLGLGRRPLRIAAEDERSRERNRERVMARLRHRVARALAPPPPRRRPTRPGRAARERRLAEKSRRSALKESRRRPEA